MGTYFYDKEELIGTVNRFFRPVNVLLDIGCGVRPTVAIESVVHICIEPSSEYIDVVRGYCPTDANYIFLRGDALTSTRNFADHSVDTVCMLDLIEHLTKEDGKALLAEATRIARIQIVVFTPLGYFPQAYHVGEKDAWGLNGAELQEHKSGWTPDDFGEGWDFHICEKYHMKDACHVPIDKDYGCFYAVKDISFDLFPEPTEVPDFVRTAASPNRILATRSFSAERQNLRLTERLPFASADSVINVAARLTPRVTVGEKMVSHYFDRQFQTLQDSVANHLETEVSRVNAQAHRIDAQVERIDAQVERIDAQVERIDAQTERIDAQTERIDAQTERIEVQLVNAENDLRVRLGRLEGLVQNVVDRRTSYLSALKRVPVLGSLLVVIARMLRRRR